jgi:photosystem II stability/assembly factor-like uncharacterized protein
MLMRAPIDSGHTVSVRARMGMWAMHWPANMPTRAATVLRDIWSLGARVSMAPASPEDAEFRAELPWVHSTDSVRIRASDYNQRIDSRIRRKLMSGLGRPKGRVLTGQLGSGGRIATQVILIGAALAALAIRGDGQSTFPDDGPTERPPGNPIALVARPDACLRDVTFIDAKRGWAVGDCGAIWHTADGGTHWEQQSSGVDCRLESVCFVDAENGWAAGGCTVGFEHLSTGILLHTTDGGQHWMRLEKILLPTLHNVKFFDATHGWAIGSGSALYPSGFFITETGGREWAPVPPKENGFHRDEIIGDLSAPGYGAAIIGGDGVALLKESSVKMTLFIRLGNYSDFDGVRSMRFSGREKGWSVGDAGFVRHTVDRGQSWHRPDDSARERRSLWVWRPRANRLRGGYGSRFKSLDCRITRLDHFSFRR